MESPPWEHPHSCQTPSASGTMRGPAPGATRPSREHKGETELRRKPPARGEHGLRAVPTADYTKADAVAETLS